ncbi:MAG TPA: hypothetical protein VE570_13580 [Thermoleophilaceae bacterium]|nr:hypothetical protein [Thermoleophilaceae bacterium]
MRISALVATLAALLLITTTAQADVPTVTSGGASAITQTTAHVAGAIKPNGQDTTWHFDYGTTAAYGALTPEQGPVKAGSGSTPVAADLGSLQPGTTYHYRLVGTNPSGTIYGKDKTFTTRPAVSIASSTATVLWGRAITISGQVFGTSAGGVTVALQENGYPFGGFAQVATTTTDASGHYQFIRSVLTNTAWRVVAQTKPAGASATAFAYEQDPVTLKASTSRPRRGKTVLFTGFAQPPRIGGDVLIQRLGRGGWHTVLRAKEAQTTAPASASFAARLRRVVSGVYRAYVPGGFDHLPGTSAVRRIKVRR